MANQTILDEIVAQIGSNGLYLAVDLKEFTNKVYTEKFSQREAKSNEETSRQGTQGRSQMNESRSRNNRSDEHDDDNETEVFRPRTYYSEQNDRFKNRKSSADQDQDQEFKYQTKTNLRKSSFYKKE